MKKTIRKNGKKTYFLSLIFFVFIFLNTFFCLQKSVQAEVKTIHILVALCDNHYQGIVPVPHSLGNGQNPDNNLYWGAAYGIKTFFKKQHDWQFLTTIKNISPEILERVIFHHKQYDVYLVADAYDGRFIRKSIDDLFLFAAGYNKQTLTFNNQIFSIAGGAQYLVYVGHNGLMDFKVESVAQKMGDSGSRSVAAFACMSQQYFSLPLRDAGVKTGFFTTQFMAPEAYSVHTLIDGWLKQESPNTIHKRVAKIYSQYQKLKSPALKLFSTKFSDE